MRKRIYRKKGYKVYEFYFETLQSLIDYITTAHTNTRVFNESCLSSNRDSDTIYSSRKTHSLDEAIRLCIGGWDEKFDSLLELKSNVDKKILKERICSSKIKDYVGFAPSVGDYLQGKPLNMWNRIKVPNYEIINIYVNIAFTCSEEISAIYNRGAIVLSIIDALEKAGYGVRLTLFEFATRYSEACLYYFNIKDETENLNMKKAYFVLCHPSFLRRICFRLKEVTEFEDEGWADDYGFVPDKKTTMDFFNFDEESDVVILSPDSMGIEGNDIYEDLETVLKATNLSKFFKF